MNLATLTAYSILWLIIIGILTELFLNAELMDF